MAFFSQVSKNILSSAGSNIISNLCSNLIFIFLVHFISINNDNPSLHQSGLNIGGSLISIIFESVITSFSIGLKILYAQYDSVKDQQDNNLINNIEISSHLPKNKVNKKQNGILYQSIILTWAIGVVVFIITLITIDFVLGTILSYEQVIIDVSRTGFIYIFISKLFMIVYDFTRSQLNGLKIFGSFAMIQTFSFLFCFGISIFLKIGLAEAGMILIFHEVIKVIMLIIYLRKYKIGSAFTIIDIIENIKFNMEDIRKLKDLIFYFKDIFFLMFCQFSFFNISIILSGKFPPHYIVACVCFSITNTFLFKGIYGLSECVVSFCGSSLTAQNFKNVKSYLNHSIIILLIFKCVAIFSLLLFSKEWATSFSLDPLTLQTIDENKYVYLLTVPFDGLQVLYASYLQTIEHKYYVAKITIMSYILIGIPLMFILSTLLEMKVGGIWLAVGIANALNCYFFIKQALSCDLNQSYQIAQKYLKANELVQNNIHKPLLQKYELKDKFENQN